MNNNELDKISSFLGIITWKIIRDLYSEKKEIIDELTKSEAKKKVWDLCNGKNNQADIARNLERDKTTIKEHLDIFIESDLVIPVKINKKNCFLSLECIMNYVINNINWFE